MKKVFANHEQCAHVWAAQSQPEGRASRIFFEGPTIYSYGRHYPIASFVKPGIVLFNADGYSVSTAKHSGHVWRALRGLNVEIIEVPTECVTSRYHDAAMQSFHDRRAERLNKAARSRTYTDMYLAEATKLEADAQRYALAFDLPAPVFEPYNRDALLAKAKEQARINREANAERARRKAEAEAQHDARWPIVLDAWRNRQQLSGDYAHIGSYPDKPTALRLSVNGLAVETSRGAEVPIADARKLWNYIALVVARKKGAEGNVLDGSVGAFTLREIRADGTAIVGCHTLTFEETSAFAKAQGWAE